MEKLHYLTIWEKRVLLVEKPEVLLSQSGLRWLIIIIRRLLLLIRQGMSSLLRLEREARNLPILRLLWLRLMIAWCLRRLNQSIMRRLLECLLLLQWLRLINLVIIWNRSKLTLPSMVWLQRIGEERRLLLGFLQKLVRELMSC